MVVYRKRSTRDETNRLLGDVHEEVKQLRAAVQMYAALVERLLAAGEANRTVQRAGRLERVIAIKEAS
jgi:hypothetical protein